MTGYRGAAESLEPLTVLRASSTLPFFADAHRAFAESFGTWVDRTLGDFDASDGGDGEDARRIFTLLGRGGWLNAVVCDDPGRIDLRRACLMREILAHRSAIADIAFSEPWLATLPLILRGTPQQYERHVAGFSAGRTLLAFALSEPEAGSDVAAIATTAIERDGTFVVEGRKTWTSNSGVADGYVMFARVGDGAGKDGISAFVVPGDQPGIELVQRIPVLSPHTVGTLAFRQCAAEALIGNPGEGFAIAMRALELFRPTVAAACVGLARRAFEAAVARCAQRVAFGRPIGQHQLIQAKLADMAVKINTAALVTYQAAWAADRNEMDAAMLGSLAKLHASEAAQQVVDDAVQIFGGLGVARGETVERLYRHVRAFRIFDGTSEIQRLIIARHLLG